MVKLSNEGTIGELDVEVSIVGGDEELANLVYADLVGRADELKQMVDYDIPPEGTEPHIRAKWDEYLAERQAVPESDGDA